MLPDPVTINTRITFLASEILFFSPKLSDSGAIASTKPWGRRETLSNIASRRLRISQQFFRFFRRVEHPTENTPRRWNSKFTPENFTEGPNRKRRRRTSSQPSIFPGVNSLLNFGPALNQQLFRIPTFSTNASGEVNHRHHALGTLDCKQLMGWGLSIPNSLIFQSPNILGVSLYIGPMS